MRHLPNHISDMSLSLSKDMSNIGVNQYVVSKVRRNSLLGASMMNMVISDEDITVFIFGSAVEVSTTRFLYPDIDVLFCMERLEVIQERNDRRKDKMQSLMLQDEFTSPGYCLLKHLRSDSQQSIADIPWNEFYFDEEYNLLLKHSKLYSQSLSEDECIQGPAMSSKPTRYWAASDRVIAFKCQSWPYEAKPWLELQNKDGWPSDDIKRYAKDHGCFLVPVSNKTSAYPGREWRISTSLAERRLMFSLNITQLRCYILLKMINKTYLKPKVDVISSFMCKCILFHCIAGSKFQDWQEHTLVTCLVKCLQVLLQNIQTKKCPHFFIPKNNLLAGKLTADIKLQTENILTSLIQNIDQTLQVISEIHLDLRLYVESKDFVKRAEQVSRLKKELVGESMLTIALSFGELFRFLYASILPEKDSYVATLNRMMQRFLNGKRLDYIAFRIFCPFLCSLIGTTLASDDIQHSRALSPDVVNWFTLGLCSDVASSKLKFASVLYCAGKFKRSKNVLKGP